MKAKFGMIVVAGSGKIGGHVASRNRAGAYFRTKVTPVNPSTTFQLNARNRLGTRSQSWRSLTETQRQSWNNAVANFAKTDVFGDLKNPSGFNLYGKLNNNLVAVGIAPITSAPQAGAVANVGVVSIIQAAGVQSTTVTLAAAIPAGTALKLFATAPTSAGVNFVKSEFRMIATYPSATATPIAVGISYTGRLGAFVLGQKTFFKFVFVNTTTGQESLPIQVVVFVTA